MVMMKKKSSIGRQKIAIEKIKKKNNLQVTFSKRRGGLFKKASELSTLCGVEIAVIVFSPAGKIFSFGHSDVESIVNRFLYRDRARFNHANKIMEGGDRDINTEELNRYLSHILNQLEVERKRGEELDQMKKESGKQCWWETPIEELGSDELKQLRNAMEELQKNARKQANNLLVTNYSVSCSTMEGVNRVADYMTTIPNNFGHGFRAI